MFFFAENGTKLQRSKGSLTTNFGSSSQSRLKAENKKSILQNLADVSVLPSEFYQNPQGNDMSVENVTVFLQKDLEPM